MTLPPGKQSWPKARAVAALVAGCWLAPEARACDLIGVERFVPKLVTERHGSVPRPVVSVLSVTRGTADPGMSCDDAGTIEVSVSLPADTSPQIADYGVYFRVIGGIEPDAIFPSIPVVGRVTGNEMTLSFSWLDGKPEDHQPLDLEVEAFLVSNRLSIGPSVVFRVGG